MGKYPNKGMNALAKEKPEVAKRIMGYSDGGLTRAEKLMDKNKDGKVSPKERKDYFDMMGSDRTTPPKKMMGGGHVKKYRYGGEVKKYGDGGMTVKGQNCPHRGEVRGTGAAIAGGKFTGTR